MTLQGIPADRQQPGTYRQFFFGVGPSSQTGTRDILIYGNKTSSGSMLTNTLSDPFADDSDARAKMGARSELYALYKYVRLGNKAAKVRAIAVPEGTGTMSRTLTFAGVAATRQTVGIISFQGQTTEFLVPLGATAIDQAAAFANAFNSANNGEWLGTAAVGGGGSEHIVTVSLSQLGTRLLPLANISLRFAYREDPTTTATFGAAAVAGADDDFTTAYAQAATSFHYYQVNPKTGVVAPTTTDNGIGEGIAYLRDQNLPANGKAQTMYFGLTGTQAQATTVVTDPDVNEVAAFFYRAEDSDWTAGMIAAAMCGIKSAAQAVHPCANINGYKSGLDNKGRVRVMPGPPDPFDKTDRPTDQEIEADLKNGISPINFDAGGNPFLVRDVTSYTEISAGIKSYNAHEGHIPSGIHFTWDVLYGRWEAEKQDFVADDPPSGGKPTPNTSTPSQLIGLINGVITDLAGPKPLGIYNGPVLSPSAADIEYMRESIDVQRVSGGFQVSVDFRVVEHLIRTEVEVRQTNTASF